MNSRSYFTARSLSTYGLTGSMKATLIKSRHLSDLAVVSSALATGPVGEHKARPCATSAGAVVARADRFQLALKPSARTERCSGENWPLNDGCGQSEFKVQCMLSAAGTQASWLVPIRSRSRCSDSGRVPASPSTRAAGSVECRPFA